MSLDNDNDLICRGIVTDANKLRHSNVQKKSIKEYITDILRRINDELILAHREGNYNIITNIPIIFDVPNMTNRVSQRIIWYHVMKQLLDKNYRININPTKDFCRLQITWITKDDEQMIALQTQVIAEHTKRF